MNDNFNIAKNFFEIGENLFSEKKYEEAEKNFNLSLNFLPNRVSTLINLGLCKIKLKKFEECEVIINQVNDLKDSSFEFKNLKCLYYGETLQFKKSIDLINEIFTSEKKLSEIKFSDLLNYQGIAYSKLKDYKKSIKLQSNSIKLNPKNYDAHCNLGFNNLVLGNFNQGWEKYEFRLKRNNLDTSKYPDSLSDIKNKKILIKSEQGLGDVIQFSRFLPRLYDYTKLISVLIPKPLEKLFNYKDIKFFSSSYYNPRNYDYEIYIGSLPYFLNNYDNFFNNQSIINREVFNEINTDNEIDKNINIGIAWSGNQNFRYDIMRSLKLIDLKNLLSIENKNIKFYCLQKDIRSSDQEYFKKIKINNLGHLDFYNLAKKIINFDLVISSDTSILHLASALNIKTFGLISFVPDWRWGLDGNKSNWYNTLELFRQSKNLEWSDVIEKVVLEVKKL